jgi:hypothetical protein
MHRSNKLIFFVFTLCYASSSVENPDFIGSLCRIKSSLDGLSWEYGRPFLGIVHNAIIFQLSIFVVQNSLAYLG